MMHQCGNHTQCNTRENVRIVALAWPECLSVICDRWERRTRAENYAPLIEWITTNTIIWKQFSIQINWNSQILLRIMVMNIKCSISYIRVLEGFFGSTFSTTRWIRQGEHDWSVMVFGHILKNLRGEEAGCCRCTNDYLNENANCEM